MDSQYRIVLFNGKKDYELELYEDDNLKNLNMDIIIEVNEFSKLGVTLEGNYGDYFEMPEMDDYFIPNRISPGDDGYYRYQANEYFSLFNYNDNDGSEKVQVVPLVPGLYTIRSFIGGINYYSYFYVVPKDLTMPDWKKMKDEVESAISGLSVDYFRRKNSESVLENTTEDDVNISLSKINLFLKQEKQIRFITEKLRKEARYKIGKKYNWNPNGAKNLADSMTIKKMGERPDKQGMVFSAKRYLEYNVPENRWAKIIITYFIMFATRSIEKLENIKTGLEKTRHSNQRYDNRRKESDVYFQKNRLQNNLESVSIDIDRLVQLVFYFQNVLTDDFLNESIGNVNTKVPKALILNPQYNFLYKLYVILNKKKSEVTLDKSYEYFWKRTDELYEIWTYIKTIEALTKNNYQPVEGWIFSKNPYEDILPSLEENEVVIFRNQDGNSVRLVFNSEIKKGSKSTKDHPLLTDSNRNKPDIRLDMFDLNEEYAGSILLDAKYQRLQRILSGSARSKNGVMEQFREYKKTPYVSKGYWHVDELLQSQLMPVQAVVVLYAKNDGSKIKSQTLDQNIFINELNPHGGMTDFISLLGNQISERYEIFEKYYKASDNVKHN